MRVCVPAFVSLLVAAALGSCCFLLLIWNVDLTISFVSLLVAAASGSCCFLLFIWNVDLTISKFDRYYFSVSISAVCLSYVSFCLSHVYPLSFGILSLFLAAATIGAVGRVYGILLSLRHCPLISGESYRYEGHSWMRMVWSSDTPARYVPVRSKATPQTWSP